MKKLIARLTLLTYFGLTCFAIGKFTYFDRDGYGLFIPQIGGFHVSNLTESN
jgi:hypothetical protein